MDDVSRRSAGRLFQMTAADAANAPAPTTVTVLAVPTVSWHQPQTRTGGVLGAVPSAAV